MLDTGKVTAGISKESGSNDQDAVHIRFFFFLHLIIQKVLETYSNIFIKKLIWDREITLDEITDAGGKRICNESLVFHFFSDFHKT